MACSRANPCWQHFAWPPQTLFVYVTIVVYMLIHEFNIESLWHRTNEDAAIHTVMFVSIEHGAQKYSPHNAHETWAAMIVQKHIYLLDSHICWHKYHNPYTSHDCQLTDFSDIPNRHHGMYYFKRMVACVSFHTLEAQRCVCAVYCICDMQYMFHDAYLCAVWSGSSESVWCKPKYMHINNKKKSLLA